MKPRPYMSEMLDNFKLVIDLVIKNSILNELAFVKLFYCEDLAIAFGGELVHHCKSSLANIPYNIILISATPLHAIVVLNCRGGEQSRRGVIEDVPGLLPMWHHRLPYCISTHSPQTTEPVNSHHEVRKNRLSP